MAQLKNYYRTLGILDSAEDVVVRAAYKALAQRYHPDKWTGDSEKATEKMIEINEAYTILSDPAKRAEYDKAYFTQNPRNQAENEFDNCDDVIDDQTDGWLIAVDFFPELSTHYKELMLISPLAANTYRAEILETKTFNKSLEIKNRLEDDFFSRYYGNSLEIRLFAKELLISKNYKAAIHLNQIITVMGKAISFQQIREQLLKKFPDVALNLERHETSKLRERLTSATYVAPYEIRALYTKLFETPLEIKTGLMQTNYSALVDGKIQTYTEKEIVQALLAKINSKT